MNAKQFKRLALSLVFPSLAFSSNAFADCSEIGKAHWDKLSRQMSDAYQEGNYEEAVNYGKMLTLICDRSPIVNFILSSSYDKLGMQDESYSYIRKASDWIQDYRIPQNIAEKIWLRRAEFELPYKKQVADLEKQLKTKDEEIAAQRAAFDAQLADASNDNLETLGASYQYYEKSMEQVMWVGTGVAVGGAVMAIIGGSLGGFYTSEANNYLDKLIQNAGDESKSKKYKSAFADNNDYKTASFIVMGVGLGLGIGGAVTAIVAHLKANEMSHAAHSTETSSDADAVSFTVSPTSVGLAVTF